MSSPGNLLSVATADVPIAAFGPPRRDEWLCLRVSRQCLRDLHRVAAAIDAPPSTAARLLLEQALEQHLASPA